MQFIFIIQFSYFLNGKVALTATEGLQVFLKFYSHLRIYFGLAKCIVSFSPYH